MRPAEVTPVVLASRGSVRREINRKCASLVTPEMCRGAAGEMRESRETMLGFFVFFNNHLFFFFSPHAGKKKQMPFKRKKQLKF